MKENLLHQKSFEFASNIVLFYEKYSKTGKTYKTVKETNVDEVFILLENLEMYIIPIKEIHNKSTLTICYKYNKYRVY